MRGGKRSSNESRNNATSRLTCMNHYSQHLDTLVSVCSLLAQSTCHRRRSWRSCLSEQRRRHDGPQATRCASLSSAISELDPPLLQSMRWTASLPALPQQRLDACHASSTLCHSVDTSYILLTVLSTSGDIYIRALAKR